MAQLLHGCATTTARIRAELQCSSASTLAAAARGGLPRGLYPSANLTITKLAHRPRSASLKHPLATRIFKEQAELAAAQCRLSRSSELSDF